jgi:Ca2+-binding RTX toxin-like protein
LAALVKDRLSAATVRTRCRVAAAKIFCLAAWGDDTLTGGTGHDEVFGEADADRMIWNPGDDSDLNEGGSGTDTVEIRGGDESETFTTTANGTRVRFDRLGSDPFVLDIGTCENLILNANGGNDTFSAVGNLAALIAITVDGGAGDDTLLGSNGIDVLRGGADHDFIDGQQGNDVILLAPATTRCNGTPATANDVIEGEAGADRLVFNGSATNEIFDLSANGRRVRFTAISPVSSWTSTASKRSTFAPSAVPTPLPSMI